MVIVDDDGEDEEEVQEILDEDEEGGGQRVPRPKASHSTGPCLYLALVHPASQPAELWDSYYTQFQHPELAALWGCYMQPTSLPRMSCIVGAILYPPQPSLPQNRQLLYPVLAHPSQEPATLWKPCYTQPTSLP